MNHINHQALILCGGKGTRFQSVSNKIPKLLAKISGKTILDWLIQDLNKFNVNRIILATGHLSEKIENYSKKITIKLLISREKKPLGTGGAIKNAENLIDEDYFFVLNGDSRIKFNLHNLYNFHKKNKAEMSILLSSITNGRDYGQVQIDDKNMITGFLEKENSDKVNYVNSGVYCIEKSLLLKMNKDKYYSLENELIPEWIKLGKVYGYVIDEPFTDIGTKERFLDAKFS